MSVKRNVTAPDGPTTEHHDPTIQNPAPPEIGKRVLV
jgi:hypothetical protein